MIHKILYVDDNPEGGRLQQALGDDFSITTAQTGTEFKRELEKSPFPYDIVLVDYRLGTEFRPGYANGIALTKDLLEVHPGAQIIGLSRYLESSLTPEPGGVIGEWILAGARWFCDKPDLLAGSDRACQILRRCAEHGARLRSLLSPIPTATLDHYPGLAATLLALRRIAQYPVPVLLTGETGTGKELLAARIHELSQRRGPFIVGNCANLRGELAEVMLHGQEFHQNDPRAPGFPKAGWFEQAEGGTVFLDEIGDLPLDAQASLLRVLQERKVRRVLGADWIPVDFRLIAATNRSLTPMAETGAFRTDLFFRIAVFQINVPALAERKSDIPKLVQYFVDRYGKLFGRRIRLSADIVNYLQRRPYPGNVRELENVIQRLIVLASSEEPALDEVRSIDRLILSPPAASSRDVVSREQYAVLLARWMRQHIEKLGAPMGFRSKTSFVRAAIEEMDSTFDLDRSFPRTPHHVLTELVQAVDKQLYHDILQRSRNAAHAGQE